MPLIQYNVARVTLLISVTYYYSNIIRLLNRINKFIIFNNDFVWELPTEFRCVHPIRHWAH